MNKLLVAVDGGSPSLAAAKKAMELADKYQAEVIVLHVEEKTPMLPSEKTFESGLNRDRVCEYPLELMGEYGNKVGIDLHLIKTQGKITGKILKVAKEFGVDMIVIGDTARKGLEKMHFGSVAESVLEKSPYPVLVVKRDSVDISDIKSLAADLSSKMCIDDDIDADIYSPYQENLERNRLVSFSFFGIFALIYFFAAIINSTSFQSIAVMSLANIPLGVWAGFSVFPIALIMCMLFLKTGGQ